MKNTEEQAHMSKTVLNDMGDGQEYLFYFLYKSCLFLLGVYKTKFIEGK